jgi:hypothetical protein
MKLKAVVRGDSDIQTFLVTTSLGVPAPGMRSDTKHELRLGPEIRCGTDFDAGLCIELGRYVEANGRFAQKWTADWRGFGRDEN